MTSSAGRTVATLPCGSCGRLNRVDLGRGSDGPKCGSCRAPIELGKPVAVTDATLQRVVTDSPVPVLVDFYADWCGPCKTMAPILDQVALEQAGRVLVAKLDTDRNPVSASSFQIRGIPTLVAFRNGREESREVGAVPKGRLDALIAGR